MQKHHTSGAGSDSSMSAFQNRRNFLFTTAGVAACLPAVALAGPSRQLGDLVQLSDEQQLDAAIEGLKAILVRMHPDCDRVKGSYLPIDGSGGMVVVDVQKDAATPPGTEPPPIEPEDPLIAEIRAYRSGLEQFEEICNCMDGLDEERMAGTFWPHQERLVNWDDPARSQAAAAEALRLALDEMQDQMVDGPAIAMVDAALGFLEGQK